MRDDLAGALIDDGASRSGHHRQGRSAWMLALAAITLLASLVTLTPAGAANEPADAGDSATDAETQNEAEPDSAPSGLQVVRYAGSDAYALSIEVAQALVDLNGGSSAWVVLASGEHWAHAAVAAPLAASLGAPVVLVPPGGLQSPTARPELVELLRSAGVRRVVLVGDPEGLPNHEPSVLFGLGMLPRNVERVWGDSPAAVSVAVAQRLGEPAEFGALGRTVIVASDQSAVDAVAVGPLAAAGPHPILLTAPSELHADVEGFLAAHDVDHVVIAGGLLSVGSAVEEAIEATGASVTRLAGSDRHHTAVLAMDLLAAAPACADTEIDTVGLAPAEWPEFAITVGALLGQQCIPLLFTDGDRLAPVTQNHLYLHRHRTGIEPRWHLIGDEVTIDPAAIQHPPVRMATVADNPDGDGQHIVVLDEHHQPTHYLLDAGFSGITDVRWTSDHTALTFTGILGGTPLAHAQVEYLAWGAPADVDDGIRNSYVLDLRSGTARLQPSVPTWLQWPDSSWYVPLIQDGWIDPVPSPGREYIVFRGPTEDHAGHSLFAFHVDSGEVRQLTHNATDDTHHVVSANWLADGRRLIYTHVTIAQLDNPGPQADTTEEKRAQAYARPAAFGSECDNAPQQRAHVLDVATGQTDPLPHGSYLVNEPFQFSPDGRFVAIKSHQAYKFAPEHADALSFELWRCSHDGVGTPSISVYDISGPRPRAASGASLSGYDPTWSPDSSYLAFRAQAGRHAGHSLYALEVESGDVAQITDNQSNEHHHMAQQWLPTGNRLLYTVQSIAELKAGGCGGLSPSQEQPSGVPHIAAHIVHVESRRSAQLKFDGFIVDGGYESGFDLSPDGDHLAFPSGSGYVFYDRRGPCRYRSEDPIKLNVFDVSASEPQAVATEAMHSTGWGWSPNGRYLAYDRNTVIDGVDRTVEEDHLILDTETDTIWQIDAESLFGVAVDLSDVEWSDDSERRLYLAYDWSGPALAVTPVIARVAARELLPLELKTDIRSSLRAAGFSPDGLQVLIEDWGAENDWWGSLRSDSLSSKSGLLYLNDVASDGALVGVYDLYAATEVAAPVLSNPPRSRHTTSWFRFRVEWTVRGIFAAGEHSLYTSPYS
ncbi:cell wall-binding repeat-containing protein [Candidatus Poriferisodalis sp.]|uniref:cell wall-binding repeat-containing protein n=1 Tax=Candidatus Poriferisodalis sp. TaxID=3101277 RepID=UPI003B01F892